MTVPHLKANLKNSLRAKPFCILTGASGTGKTQLAIRICKEFSKLTSSNDPFLPGSSIRSGRLDYLVNNSDHLAVEFWNHTDEKEATKVTLPKKIIYEWVDCIKEKGFDESISCREIRSIVSPISKFSSQLHSFETHLKAAAFAQIKSEVTGPRVSNSSIVPVGSDWTDNRPVLGFVNHLRTCETEGNLKNRPIFQTTPIVDLLLRADANQAIPHFLILDEMNLSHVERYFADFLSAMEQDKGELHFHSEGSSQDYRLPRSNEDTHGVPRSIAYPKNLFVIGTVNIDETTYMFSPKVLDRANVIEFTVGPNEFEEFLNNPSRYPEVETAEHGVAENFLQLALDAREDKIEALPDELGKTIAKHLHDLFLIMQAGRFEFAYRTGKEVNRYLRVCRHLSDDQSAWDSEAWKADLDDQILQKILPKLHGSIGRVGGLLADLTLYCANGTAALPRDDKKLSSTQRINTALELVVKPSFPHSHKKLVSMLKTLKEEQFVSFIQ